MRCPTPTVASAFVFLCACCTPAAPATPPTTASAPSISVSRPAPFTTRQRLRLFAHTVADPVAWLAPGFDAALSMAHPPRHQPAAWSVGASGFAHLYAGSLARQSAASAAQFAVAALLREDTRYRASARRNPVRRVVHAATFTLVDRGRSGHRRLAVSSLAAAFTAAALANTWQPPQFQNSTHLTQRTLTSLAALSGSTLALEFRPDAMRMARSFSRHAVAGPRALARRSRRPAIPAGFAPARLSRCDAASGRPS